MTSDVTEKFNSNVRLSCPLLHQGVTLHWTLVRLDLQHGVLGGEEAVTRNFGKSILMVSAGSKLTADKMIGFQVYLDKELLTERVRMLYFHSWCNCDELSEFYEFT
ncbi:hypothetical protein LTR37_017221 [Vermiconidia calcicola]|uniref:Uncharacterized protein n=1 Tax=Vermiconidia calcicola TaxID=1690605 RepID=A0ACC3MM83_9PEZI|nr:hypothetical protein LTR37_017221 [Vermiconidia calcicola]